MIKTLVTKLERGRTKVGDAVTLVHDLHAKDRLELVLERHKAADATELIDDQSWVLATL